jgi:hypothetical protein
MLPLWQFPESLFDKMVYMLEQHMFTIKPFSSTGSVVCCTVLYCIVVYFHICTRHSERSCWCTQYLYVNIRVNVP